MLICSAHDTHAELALQACAAGPLGGNGIQDAAGYNLHWIWHVMRSQPVEVTALEYDGQLPASIERFGD